MNLNSELTYIELLESIGLSDSKEISAIIKELKPAKKYSGPGVWIKAAYKGYLETSMFTVNTEKN
jgi:hypothetical protein